MVLGQSASEAAVMAIDANVPLQNIDVPKLQRRLLREKQILKWSPSK
jgi:hypothetical protein